MKHDEKKVAKIIEELMMFFFGIGGNDMNSHVTREGHNVKISFISNYDKKCEYKLESMEEYLKGQRIDGIEDIYWELVGSGDPGESSQLLLIGMMVDKAVVTKEGDYVSIELEKRMY